MTTHDQLVHRWVQFQLGERKTYPARAGNLVANDKSLFSYGAHFEMARLVRNEKGKPLFWLENGERFSPTTSQHQSLVRSYLHSGTLAGGFPWVTIPHQALEAAGIDFDSIRIVESLPDRWEEQETVTYDFPEGAVWGEITVYDKHGVGMNLDAAGEPWTDRFPEVSWRAPLWGLQARLVSALRREDEKRRGKHWGHYGQVTHRESRLFVSEWARKTDRHTFWEVEHQADGRIKYRRTWSQHWLGESLVTANVVWTTWKTCKRCGGSGRFTGDSWTDRWGNVFDRYCSACEGRGGNRSQGKRKAHFLSGFDYQESPAAYFFCELPPKARPTSVAEAYEVLKPDPVKLAEQMGRAVKRQGDIFAVPLTVSTRDLTKQGATRAKHAYILGTNHRATEVATLPDGTTLVRGTLTHAPQRRRPDHRRVAVGKAWSLAIKNTVPITR